MQKTTPPRYSMKACILPEIKIVTVAIYSELEEHIFYNNGKELVEVPFQNVMWIKPDHHGRPKIN